jgi:hypothetical protein
VIGRSSTGKPRNIAKPAVEHLGLPNCLDYRNYQLAPLRSEWCNNQSRRRKNPRSFKEFESMSCQVAILYNRAAVSHHRLRPPRWILISTLDKRRLERVWYRLSDDRRQGPSPRTSMLASELNRRDRRVGSKALFELASSRQAHTEPPSGEVSASTADLLA